MPALEVSTSEYRFSHGGAPRGRGAWRFGLRFYGAWHDFAPRGLLLYSEAKNDALKMARKVGADAVKVLP